MRSPLPDPPPQGGREILQSVAVSTASQIVARVLTLVVNVVASLAIVRYLGPAGYGDYVFVVTFIALVGMINDLGLPRVAVREMSRHESSASEILGTTILARVALSVFCTALAQIILILMGARPEIHLAVLVASALLLTEALVTVTIVFQVRLALQFDALVTVATQAVRTVIILWLISRSAGWISLIGASVAASVAGLVFAYAITHYRFKARARLNLGRLPYLVAEAWPYGVAVLVAVTYLKLDSVLLAVLRTPKDVGLYGAAYKPIEYLLLGSLVLINPLFPLLSRWYQSDPRRFQIVYQRGTQGMLAYGLPLCVAALLLAGPLVVAAYGVAFRDSALPLQILGIALVLMVFNVWQGPVLLAGGHKWTVFAYDLAGLAVNVALNLLLIPRLGSLGAAIASLATSIFIAGCAGWAGRALMGVTPAFHRLLPVLLANASLAVTLWFLLRSGSWVVAAGVAALAYPVYLLVFRMTTIEEVRLIIPHRVTEEVPVAVNVRA